MGFYKLNGKIMDVEKVKALKAELELDIANEISSLVDAFTQETGLSISSVGVEVLDKSQLGGVGSDYIVSKAFVGIAV